MNIVNAVQTKLSLADIHTVKRLNLTESLVTYTRQLKSASWSMNSKSWLIS